jgi:methylaspartate mutase epsilon subunit
MTAPSRNNCIVDLDAARAGYIGHASLVGRTDDDVRAFLAGLSENRMAAKAYDQRRNSPLVQPRGGVPTFEKQQKLSSALAAAGADFLPLTIDSHTRLNDFERAALLLEESETRGEDLLNGYPLVAHGWNLTRYLFEGLEHPVSLRHGTADARVLVEHALAAGITEIEGGALCYTLPYNSRYPLDRALLHWQVVDRLCAEMSEPGRAIHRESFGPLTATMVPPAMVAAVELCELLLAAEQGVTSFAVSFGQTGSFQQDAALANVLRGQAKNLLMRFGFEDVRVVLGYHQWMGPFPLDRDAADDLIAAAASAAMAIKADKIITKTHDEAFGIPTIEANTHAVRQVKRIFGHFQVSDAVSNPAIDEEIAHLNSMVDCIMDAIFKLPGATFVASVLDAVRRGIIDIPFAPHLANRNRLLSLRDQAGAIRISDCGDVPVPAACLAREREMIATRKDNDLPAYERLFRDITMFAAT